jgi:hypothetical protein
MLWFNSSSPQGSLITKELSYKMRLISNHLNVMATDNGLAPWDYNSTDNGVTFDNNWHHIAVTIAPDFVDWYYDGISFHHEGGIGTLGANTQPLMIGSYGNGTSEFFTGMIGPARLYNYALTSSAVSTYYNATKDRYQPVAITHTALQSADNNGSNGVHLDTVTYDDWVSSVPVGATIVADTNPFVTTTVTSIHTPTEPGNFSANWWFEISPGTANFPSGTTFTISWTA